MVGLSHLRVPWQVSDTSVNYFLSIFQKRANLIAFGLRCNQFLRCTTVESFLLFPYFYSFFSKIRIIIIKKNNNNANSIRRLICEISYIHKYLVKSVGLP